MKNTPAGYIEIGYRVIVDGIIIFVRDSGEGISKKDQHKIFDRFEKIDSFKPGIGLGMTINKGIIDSYGGSIELISEIGKGTEFRAFIPTGL